MVDWSGAIGTDRGVLMRIAALLLSLADLAERAVGAPCFVRREVFWALRQADAVVWEFLAGSPCEGDQWPPASMPVHRDLDPAAAESLAVSLRMLAFMVQAMAARTTTVETGRQRFMVFRSKTQPRAVLRRREEQNHPLRSARAPPRPPSRQCAHRLSFSQEFNGQG